MNLLLAATDPGTGVTNYFLTQGVLGVTVVALIIVVIYQQRKIDKKDARIEELQELRLGDAKETSKEVTEVLQGNSQNMAILSEKISIGKGRA